jgi:hypothetical protein
MAPFIRNGDVVTISPLRDRRIRLGEVVAFVGRARGLVVHRVTAQRSGCYEIRADSLAGPGDVEAVDIVPAADVLGTVSRVERNARRVRLGLGRERVLVAVLSRLGLLRPLVAALRAARAPFVGQRVL